ncbi:uncharacterized protein LOC129892887 [Solanum dulcamara]|uniref:uncharacterized protein LOC129892887 n=1 Tax=Solanum dulcamara TaxID=45834 RepID=UPI002486C723|nr:uncharacterized protein LOC129892887 [Solanum dulcamara]
MQVAGASEAANSNKLQLHKPCTIAAAADLKDLQPFPAHNNNNPKSLADTRETTAVLVCGPTDSAGHTEAPYASTTSTIQQHQQQHKPKATHNSVTVSKISTICIMQHQTDPTCYSMIAYVATTGLKKSQPKRITGDVSRATLKKLAD